MCVGKISAVWASFEMKGFQSWKIRRKKKEKGIERSRGWTVLGWMVQRVNGPGCERSWSERSWVWTVLGVNGPGVNCPGCERSRGWTALKVNSPGSVLCSSHRTCVAYCFFFLFSFFLFFFLALLLWLLKKKSKVFKYAKLPSHRSQRALTEIVSKITPNLGLVL